MPLRDGMPPRVLDGITSVSQRISRTATRLSSSLGADLIKQLIHRRRKTIEMGESDKGACWSDDYIARELFHIRLRNSPKWAAMNLFSTQPQAE